MFVEVCGEMDDGIVVRNCLDGLLVQNVKTRTALKIVG